jgi:ribonucleoside-diphosphate reductase subunit M1
MASEKSDITSDSDMFVIKRDERNQKVILEKLNSRIKKLCYGLDMKLIDPLAIALKVICYSIL